MQEYQQRRIRIASLVVLGVIVPFLVAAHTLDDFVDSEVSDDSEVQELNDQIAEKSAGIEELEKRLKVYQDNIKEKQREQFNLENEISILENRINATRDEIQKNELELDATQLEIQLIQAQIRFASEDIERNKEIIKDLLADVYLQDQKTPLEITFSNPSLSAFYSSIEYTRHIQSDMQSTLDTVQAAQIELEEHRTELKDRKASLAQQTQELEVEQDQLAGEEQYKQQLLDETELSEEKFQLLLANARQEQQRIEGEIAGLQNAAQERILEIRQDIRARLEDGDETVTEEDQNFLNGDVSFIWPTPPTKITCEYHCAGYPFESYIGPHSGIDIGIPMGTAIRASASGYVVRAVFDGTSNLSWVMIDHGEGLATVYMHTSSIAVNVDQYVRRGDIIGYSGGMPGTPGAGLSTGPHLHFEIRVNGIPTNPREYLP